MSYEHLAGRLIETQRSLLGQRAIEIAQSVEGLSVNNDGTVVDVTDDDREVIGALVDTYVAEIGQPAMSRLQSASAEFEDEVVLPENLDGPSDPTISDSDRTEGTTEESSTENHITENLEERKNTTDTGTVVEYSTPSNTTLTGDIDTADDLASVYVVAVDENGWEWRLPVEDAVLNAVMSATDLSISDVDSLQEYVDTSVVEAAPGTDGSVSFSFDIEGHDVTLQPDGNVHIDN